VALFYPVVCFEFSIAIQHHPAHSFLFFTFMDIDEIKLMLNSHGKPGRSFFSGLAVIDFES